MAKREYKSLFGNLFDYDGDGKANEEEDIMGLAMMQQVLDEEEEEEREREAELDALLDDKPDYSWRAFCEDGSDYDISPYRYKTEEEYNEALEEARTAWRLTCEDGSEYMLDPEDYETEEEYMEALEEARQADGSPTNVAPNPNDYPNKRMYQAAYTIAVEPYMSDEIIARCLFITENVDTIVAANYVTTYGEFLYAQAIKDHFALPCSLPDEDEKREMEFPNVILKIAKRDIPLSLDIWAWCAKQFLPYAQYDRYAADSLNRDVINSINSFPDGYKAKLVHYLNDHPDFMSALLSAGCDVSNYQSDLVAAAITEGLYETAKQLFASGIQKGGWKQINAFTGFVIGECKNDKELESIEHFRDHLLPLVKAIPDGMVQDEIAEWEADIAKYIDKVEDSCEQYAYTRKNAWRKNVPDGKAYNVDPTDYHTEQEYLDALNEAKYRWRSWYDEDDRLGLDITAYETEDAFKQALREKREEQREIERQEREQERERKLEQKRQAEQALLESYADDKTIYTYCGVLFPFSERPYSFRTEDETIQIGDHVVAPVGDGNTEMMGTVVSIGKYARQGVPYPVEKTKMITRKLGGQE